jgi:hypothetical protein
LTIHTLPNGLANRKFLTAKYWAEYFDGECMKVVLIPGVVQE